MKTKFQYRLTSALTTFSAAAGTSVIALKVGMIAAALLALGAIASPARAHTYPGEIRHDRRELRADYRELARDRADWRHAVTTGDRAGTRHERSEIRQDRREIRRDRAELRRDVRHWRHHHAGPWRHLS